MENTTLTSSEKQTALFTHIAALAGMFIPFGNIIGPLIAWQSKKNESEFVDENGKQSMNFQITFSIFYLIGFALYFWQIIRFISKMEQTANMGVQGPEEMFGLFGAFIFPVLFIVILGIINTIFVIIAAVKSQNGEVYNYPLKFRFIK